MSFDGKTIEINYWFNGQKGNFDDPAHKWGLSQTGWYPGWGTKVVGPGPEITNFDTLSPNYNPFSWEQTTGIFSMDFSGKGLNIQFYDTGLFKYHNYNWNGPAFSDVGINNLPKIIGFRLTTNMSFLDASDIKIMDNGNTVLIDWFWGTFDKTTYVNLDFKFEIDPPPGGKYYPFKGTKGNDYITAGKGADVIAGGKGADVFVFHKGDTGKTKKKADLITDFSAKQGDKIDLHKWDADSTTKGVQDFDFIGKHKFTKEAGELRYQKSGKETLLMGDTNGDGKTDFMIKFKGHITFADGDFIL